MSWQWVDNLFSSQDKKKFYWDARCPYGLCPSNQPYQGCHQARLKYVQEVAPMVKQYKCKDCGCLTNFNMEQPDQNQHLKQANPVLHGGRPDYRLHV